jgi:DNA-binding transcriptional LysR family regulator
MEIEAAALVRALTTEDTRASGVVRIAATEALSRLLVVEGLLSIRREHPDLTLELIGENRPADLARGEADIAVRVAAPKQPALRARCVARMGIGLFAAAAYLRARPRIRNVAALRGHDVLLPSGELSRLPEVRWLSARPGVRVVFRSNNMPALIAAAVAAQGILPLPLHWGDNEPGVERVMVLEHIPKRGIWLAVHETAQDRPAVAVVVRQIAAILARVFAM